MILVTGGTGLVGSHLLYHLARTNDTVLAIYRTKATIKKVATVFSYYTEDTISLLKKIQWIQADITEIPSLHRVFSYAITYVYHCAALVSFDSKEYKKMRSVNIDGTANIVNFCIEKRVQKLCFVSSIAAIGDAVGEKKIDEESEWNNTEDSYGYSITKYGAEIEVWRGSQEGIDVVVVNPGVIIGSGFWKEGSGKLWDTINKGLRFYTEGVTGFVGVKDVVRMMIELTQGSVKNERFILVSENKSFKDVLFSIAKYLHKKAPSIKIGKPIMSLLWRLDWFFTLFTRKKPLLTKNSAKSSHNKSYYSNKKITEMLDTTFTPIDVVIKEISEDYLSKK